MLFFPNTVEELFSLQEQQPEAGIMAGGTDLLVALRHTPQDRQAVICLERIAELTRIDVLPDGGVSVGSGVPFSAIIRHPLLRERYPLLVQAAATVGGPAIRNMATIGGNIVTASPAGDSLPALYLLDAELALQSSSGCRQIPLVDFITGPRQTVLQPGEIISRIILSPPHPWTIQRFEKVGRRKSLAIAVASLAALVELDDAGAVAAVRLAWGSVGPVIVHCPAAEAALVGRPLCEESLGAAAVHVGEAVQPIDDLRATARYRRQVAGNLLLRLVS